MKKIPAHETIDNGQMSNGFTLVELLVVVSIIAILTVIGIAVFSNVSGKARDARRKADINAIAAAYEANYSSETGRYRVLVNADFVGGKTPMPPEGGTSDYRYVLGPSASSPDTQSFKVCAALEGNTDSGSCVSTSSNCYCVSSAQGVGSISPTACTTITNGTCKAKHTSGTDSVPSPIYIACPRALDCSVTTQDTALLSGVAYFTQPSGGTAATITVNIYRGGIPNPPCDPNGTPPCTAVTVSPHVP